MDNDTGSQEKSSLGWKVFLDEAKRRFTDAKTRDERLGFRSSIKAFERLIRAGAKMPRESATSN